ncbi:MAG: DUF1343 domain-containing protein [Parachlamydiales bacterium]|nr:DUF1343 domain-containing protein [Parachlamydiales bacterium]
MLKLIIVSLFIPLMAFAKIELGIDRLLSDQKYFELVHNKRVGLVTNHTALTGNLESSIDQLMKSTDLQVVALFSPEHGLNGQSHANDEVDYQNHNYSIPVYSLHGKTRRPTTDMLKDIDVLIFDIQDIGSRSYSYCSTLFYVMEEASKHNIKVIVTDRPNPMGGLIVDGPMMEEQFRSFLGYINVPYCHGMTIGELALLFNHEYKVGCKLTVIPMRGWKRSMSFRDTGLTWVPTSPQIPEMDTPFFYPTTGGILGELHIVNIGIGYTLPFKIVGAPWINAEKFAAKLNAQHFDGVYFQPFHFRPFFGAHKMKNCQGVRIVITDEKRFLPITTQFLIVGILKSMYPKQFKEGLEKAKSQQKLLQKINGTDEVMRIISEEKYVIYALKKICDDARVSFLPIRNQYLIAEYKN